MSEAQITRLRELAADIANCKAVAAVLRYRGDNRAEQAEKDLQECWMEFSAQLADINPLAANER